MVFLGSGICPKIIVTLISRKQAVADPCGGGWMGRWRDDGWGDVKPLRLLRLMQGGRN